MVGKTILVVDDEPFIVETVKFSLEQAGFECLVAYDGVQAIEKARNEEPDLILLDIVLPKLDGYKVCQVLKHDERYRHIPIIMLTARNQEKEKKIAMVMGADEFITKPFDSDELIESITRHLGIKGD